MNVLIITEEDVFYVYEFFKTFYKLSKNSDYTIKCVTILPAFNKKSQFDLAKQMLNFYGFFNFIRMGSWYTFRILTGKTVRNLSKKNHTSLIDTENVNNQYYINIIKKMKIDIIVSIAAPQIFKKALLNSVPYGCINSHSALLPENKGMMPVFWCMYKNSKKTGVTIHYMNESFDSGNIIDQKEVKIGQESLHQMILKTKRLSAKMIHSSLNKIKKGDLNTTPMPGGGSYQSFPDSSHIKHFKSSGRKVI